MSSSGEKLPEERSGDIRRTHGWRAWLFVPRGRKGYRRSILIRLGAAAGVLLLSGYIGAATAAPTYFQRSRGIEGLRVVDFLFPWRWENFQVARGNSYIASAQRCVGEKKPLEALMYARAGIGLAPRNRDGRLLLAELSIAADRSAFAKETLLQGMAWHGSDIDYLRPTLTFLFQRQDDAGVVELVQRSLPTVHDQSEAARLLRLASATADCFRGNYDRAEAMIRRAPQLDHLRDARLLLARIDRDRGHPDLALFQMRQLSTEFPRDWEVQRDLIDLLRRKGLTAEARRSSLAFQIRCPDLAAPRLALLQIYHEAKEAASLERELEALVHDFGHDRNVMLDLAEFAANGGDSALLRRITDHAVTRRWPVEPYRFLAIEAAIVARDFAGAIELIRSHRGVGEEVDPGQQAIFDSLRAMAHCGLGDAVNARLFLNKALDQSRGRAGNLIAMADRFAALDAPEQAWLALAQAVKSNPLDQAALARLIELDLVLNRVDDLGRHVQAFMSMRRPSPEILRVVQHKLGSDLFLFSSDAAATLAAVRDGLAQPQRYARSH